MYGIECIEEDLKLVQDGGDVTDGRGFGDNTGSSVLDQLEFVGETKQKGVAVIQA